MTKELVLVYPNTRVTEIIRTIEDHAFDHLPVVDNENKLIGIISKTDLYNRALSLSRSTSGKTYSEKLLFSTRAEEIMSHNPISIDSSQTTDHAVDLLLQNQFHALPVVSDEVLVGIITSQDILEAMTK